jgi:hypothetical protein
MSLRILIIDDHEARRCAAKRPPDATRSTKADDDVLKSDADENLMTAVDSRRQHKPFLRRR